RIANVVNHWRLSVKPKRNPIVQTKLLPDGHIVLFAEDHDWAHTLTPLAGIAWEYCDGESTVDDIIDQVAETAGLQSSSDIKPDLSKLFEELYGSGLLIPA